MQDKRVLVKGCSDFSIPENAYVELVEKLRPIVKSLMFGRLAVMFRFSKINAKLILFFKFVE